MKRQTLIESYLSPAALRYLLVGSATFIIEYIVFYILYVFLHWNLLLANSLSFGVGLATSFSLNRIWAFKQQEFQRPVHHQAMLYIALALTNLFINNAIVASLNAVGLDPRIGKIVAIATIALWNFLIFRAIIFKGKGQR